MSVQSEKYAKILRQSIMAIAIKKHGWSYEEFHSLMEEWGYGRSLRDLKIPILKQLKHEITGSHVYQYNDPWKLDKQGMYMWSLMKQVGWNKKRITMLMLKKYKKMHWNILTETEKRQVINILKGYEKKL